MDWQDELRALDEKLSSGAISSTEYRKLRDQVLAEASSGGSVPQRPAGAGQATDPGAESMRLHIPESAAADSPSGEMTQVINVRQAAMITPPVQQPAPPTTAAQPSPPQPEQAQQAAPEPAPAPATAPAPAQPTPPQATPPQATPAQGTAPAPAQSAPVQPAPAQPTAAQPAPAQPVSPQSVPVQSVPPQAVSPQAVGARSGQTPVDSEQTQIVGADEATLTVDPKAYEPPARSVSPPSPWETNHPISAAPVEGNEVFSVAKKPRSSRRIALGSLITFLVLALVGAGVWWFLLGNDDSKTATPATSNTPTASVPAPDDLEAKLPPLPGTQNPNNSTMSIDRAVQLKIVPKAEADAFKAAGATEVVYRAAAQDGVGVTVLVVPAPAAGAASKVMLANLDSLGFTDVNLDLPGNPSTAQVSDEQARYVGAVYDSDRLGVLVLGTQRLSGDEKALSGRLSEVLQGLVGALPPH